MKPILFFAAFAIAILINACQSKSDKITFEVIEKKEVKAFNKALIQVRIDSALTEIDLRKVASQVKELHPGYSNYMINYYLSNQETNSTAYAVTNYNPDEYIFVNGVK